MVLKIPGNFVITLPKSSRDLRRVLTAIGLLTALEISVLESTIFDVVLLGLDSAKQTLKSVKITSIADNANGSLSVNYDLVIEQKCGDPSCSTPANIASIVTKLNSNFDEQIANRTFDTLLQANIADDCPTTTSCANIIASEFNFVDITLSPTRAPTNAPTINPLYSTLPSVGGCPAEFSDSNIVYGAGDRVSTGSIVFECKSWPNNLYCSQAAFRPDLDSKTEFWKQAWQIVGICSGIITPTNSTSGLIGCPAEWMSSGDLTKYRENDVVSVIKSYTPLIKAVYKCKAWPNSLYCAQFSPIHPNGGNLGWEYVAGCTGTIAPTISPTFLPGTLIVGCPTYYNSAHTAYKPGDQVSWADKNLPYKIVYQCRDFPYSGYCNQKGFAPGDQYADMAWTKIGPCEGTQPPTSAPTEFIPGASCTYVKIIKTTPTSTSVVTPIAKWTSGTLYEAGDQVRIGAKKFQCKPYPFYLWCRMAAYAPTDSATGLWTDAWTPAGTCESG